jgi:hypothetical protein
MIFLISFTFSCKKKNDTVKFTGTVTSPNEQSPVADAFIELQCQEISNSTWNANYSTVVYGSTDANGAFSFSFKSTRAAAFRVVINKDNYYEFAEEIDPDNLEGGDGYSAYYCIYPKAWLKLHIKNTSPYDAADYFDYKLLNGTLTGAGCCGDSLHSFAGITIDTLSKCSVTGHQNIIIKSHVTKHNIPHEYYDTVFVTRFDTTSFDLFY